MSTQSASGVLKRLITIYLTGSLAAVAVTFFLMMLGLQLTLAQWTLLALLTPLAVPGFVLVDVLVIRRHFRPIGQALTLLDAGQALPLDNIS